MGGWGSGARSNWRTPLALESLCRIDLQAYGKEGYLAAGSRTVSEVMLGRRGIGSISRVTVSVTADGDQVVVDLNYADTTNGTAIVIDLVPRPSPLGASRGTIWLGRCPGCQRRCRVLLASTIGVGCRGCQGNRYLLQGLAPLPRIRLQRRRILARLGVEEQERGPILRPKGMRIRTFERLKARADTLQQYIAEEESKRTRSIDRFLDRQDQWLQSVKQRMPALLYGASPK